MSGRPTGRSIHIISIYYEISARHKPGSGPHLSQTIQRDARMHAMRRCRRLSLQPRGWGCRVKERRSICRMVLWLQRLNADDAIAAALLTCCCCWCPCCCPRCAWRGCCCVVAAAVVVTLVVVAVVVAVVVVVVVAAAAAPAAGVAYLLLLLLPLLPLMYVVAVAAAPVAAAPAAAPADLPSLLFTAQLFILSFFFPKYNSVTRKPKEISFA